MKRTLNTLGDAELALRPYVPLVKQLTGKDTVFDRIEPLMAYLGNPENKIRAIHIAGTSGKTSTAYYVSKLLTLAGYNVGLTVSPHIDKVTERAQINSQPIEDNVFCQELAEFLDLVDSSGIKPSYFELIYSFSIWLFAKLGLDYVVVETGMGGLFDATNVIRREDKVCVITDIGFDHMHILGHTLKEITSQKVGIVQKHNSLIMYKQNEEIMSVINKSVKEHDAKIYLTSEEKEKALYGNTGYFNKLPDFQKRNWLLAYCTYRFVRDRDSIKDLSNREITISQKIQVPARMDISYKKGHRVIMDGAHNYQKMAAFISSYKHMFTGQKAAVLLAFKNDKAYTEALPLIKDIASEIIVTTFKTSQDLPVESCSPEDITQALKKIDAGNVSAITDNLEAFKKLLKSKTKNVIITGSFYLIAQIRESLNK